MDAEKLIEAIRSFCCLWDVSNKSYKDLRARKNAWKEVATKVRNNFPQHQLETITTALLHD